tara:strand:+ start:154 stop:5358 length:5205 start_codon:yes stop_codon:yes gene_type:complete
MRLLFTVIVFSTSLNFFAQEYVSVFDIISESESHNILENAIVASELDSILASYSNLTLFAPTDEAFDNLPVGTLDALLADTESLSEILLYHLVGDVAMSTDLSDSMTIATLQGDNILVGISNGEVTINNATILVADLNADNGVVHVIDAILLPNINEQEEIYGCNDSSAINYNPDATEDDGSCEYEIVLYSEDFSNGFHNWTIYDNFNNSIWVWVSPDDMGYYFDSTATGVNHPAGEFSNNIGTLESPTESNGWVIFDNDYFNSPISDGVYDTNGHITSPYLDFSEQESVIVNWQQYFRYCCYPYAPIFLDVSIDGGMHWERFEAHGDFIESANSASVNPMNTTVDISCIAAYQSNVQIRFTYEQPWEVGTGYSHYYWGIDDVIIYSNTSEYDVAITHFATADVVNNYDYFDIPLEQSQMIEITPGVGYQNNGLNDVNDLEIMINFSDSNGDTVWEAFEYVGYLESSTSSGSCPANISDTAIVYTAFSPWEIDDYTVTANIYSMIDGDENDSNNVASKRLSITENSFSHADFQNIDGHIGSSPEDEYIYRPAGFGSIYYMYSGSEAYGVNVLFGDSCGYAQNGSQQDLWFYLRVYEYNGNDFVHEWNYYEEFFFQFDPQWAGEEVFLPFDYPIYLGDNTNYAITIISEFFQEARLEVKTNANYNPDNSSIRYNQSGDGDYIWFYNQTFTPAMSLYFGVPEDDDEDDDEEDDTSINDPPSYNNVVWSSECEVDSCSQWEFGNDGNYDLDFYCSFDGPTGPYNTWAGAENGGDIAPPMNSSTNYNGLLIVDSDAYSGGGGSIENCWVQTVNPIDCSNLDDVTISFQTRYRCWDNGSNDGNERCYVEISRDGTTWPSDTDLYDPNAGYVDINDSTTVNSRFEVFPTYETGDQSENPEHISLNISEPAAGQGQVWIRFRWVGIWGYSWEIDDIYVYQTPEYDMSIGDYFSYTNYTNTGIIEYEVWPQSQLPDELEAAVVVKNNGTQSDYPNLYLHYSEDLNQQGTVFDGYQLSQLELSTYQQDTLFAYFSPETLNSNLGTRYAQVFAGGEIGGNPSSYSGSNVLDENITNNEAFVSFEITEYSYGRDNGYAYYTGPTMFSGYEDNCYAASTVYQIFNDTEIYGIDIAVMSGSSEGALFDVFIGEYQNIDVFQGSSGDIYQQSFEYTDTSYSNEPGTDPEDIQWYTIAFDEPVYLTEGTDIYAGIFSEVYGEYGLKYGYSQESHDYTSFLYSCNDGMMYWTERTPMIRLNLNPNLNEEEEEEEEEEEDVVGCTDPSACNYDPDANENEGCFYYQEEGYCDCESMTYNGCTNPYACNYDEDASCDNGSCEGGGWSCGYDGGFITAFTKMDYGSNVDYIHGDIYITRGDNQGIYNPYYEPGYDGAWSPSGTLWKYGATEAYPDPDSYVSWFESHGGNAIDLTGQTYSLYLPDYNMYWDVYYQSWTSGSNGGGFSWVRTFKPEQSGCTYEGGAGCMDEEACNYDLFANCEGDCDYESCGGCTDPNSPNYNPDATIDDGSCIGIDPTCGNIGLEGWGVYDSGVYPENSIATYAEYTTIDLALHINAMLNEPASGEDYPLIDFMLTDVQGLPDGMDSDEAQTVLTPIDQVCVTLYGTPYETGLFNIEFTGVATISLFGLELEINNFTFNHLLMIEENANPILGCTYEGALNYDMYANMDNGSCEFEGCTDEEALNYNDIFNVDDGSCIYNLTNPGCISDINMDGIVSTGDLLLLLSDFGNYCDE